MSERRATVLGMPAARFLADFWQKKPCLIRAAFADFHAPLDANDLAGLACEEMALARLIVQTPGTATWTVRNGPFTEADFDALPRSHWTLLVQDVDKWDAAVGSLLESFDFLPDWRVDDIMVSYAVDGGSVGAHVDEYDVFLLQAAGTRRWQISTDAAAPKAFRGDSELKLLAEFKPTDEWLLEPGDMLYLPAGVPHHGIAQGDCMTFSIGLRAPSQAELFGDFADFLGEQLAESARYADADLTVPKSRGEIDAAALARVQHTLATLAAADPARLRAWFGPFITRYRQAHAPAPRPRQVSAAALRKRLQQGHGLRRNPWTRLAFARVGTSAELYASGATFACSLAAAQLITERRAIDASSAAALPEETLELLRTLLNAGHLGFDT